MFFFFNSTNHIMKSGFLKEGQTICDPQSISPSLSDPPLAFFHSIPRIPPLTPLPSRRETGVPHFYSNLKFALLTKKSYAPSF